MELSENYKELNEIVKILRVFYTMNGLLNRVEKTLVENSSNSRILMMENIKKLFNKMIETSGDNEVLKRAIKDCFLTIKDTDSIDTQFSLMERFKIAKKNALYLAYNENKETNLWNFIVSTLHSMFYKKVEMDTLKYEQFDYDMEEKREQSPYEVYVLLEKAELAINEGNMYKAVCLISHIKNYSGIVFKSWLNDAHNYIATKQIVDVLKAVTTNCYFIN